MSKAAIMLGAVTLVAAGAAPGRAQDALGAQGEDVLRVAVGGDTVAVRTTGSGPIVVIVPGLLGSAFSFRHVTPALVAAGLRVVVVDPLGTGASSRPRSADYTLEAQAQRLLEALESAGVGPALLLCHSVSGSICYRMALQQPERVRGIVAINGGPDEHAASPGLRRAMRFAPILRIVGGAGRARTKLQEGLVENSIDPAWVTREVIEAYARPYENFGEALNAMSGMASAREPEPLVPRLAQIAVPVRLLVGGGRGGVTTPEQIELLQRIPDFQAFGVAAAGQYIQEEQPQEVVTAVLSLHRATRVAQAR